MHQLPIEHQILLVVEISALAVLCLRMWVAHLQKIYAWFFGYLILELLQTSIPILVPLDSRLYRDSFVASQALILAFYPLVVLELYSKVLGDLPGIAGIARRYIKVMLFFAVGIALLLLRLGGSYASLSGFLTSFERTVMATLVIFVLLVCVFLAYYPVPLGRNVLVYLMGYAVYFLTRAAVELAMSFNYHWNRQLSSVAMVVSVLCLTFWIIALTPGGETKRVVVGHQWNPADEQKLRAQLDAINASLMRSSHK